MIVYVFCVFELPAIVLGTFWIAVFEGLTYGAHLRGRLVDPALLLASPTCVTDNATCAIYDAKP